MSALFTEHSVSLSGVRLLEPRSFRDERGVFVKTYHEELFEAAGIHFTLREEYYSVSARGVVRGMHFQVPPRDHAKLVYCLHGQVLDVLLDLRRSSPTFGCWAAQELSAANRLVFVIPPGIAHGFTAQADGSVMVYKTSTVHSAAHDAGIRWNSFGFEWGVKSPVISARDAAFPALTDFSTPFA